MSPYSQTLSCCLLTLDFPPQDINLKVAKSSQVLHFQFREDKQWKLQQVSDRCTGARRFFSDATPTVLSAEKRRFGRRENSERGGNSRHKWCSKNGKGGATFRIKAENILGPVTDEYSCNLL